LAFGHFAPPIRGTGPPSNRRNRPLFKPPLPKAVEKNFEWFEAMLYLLASGKIVFTPEEQKEYSDKCIHLLRKLMGLPLGNQ
jgi:hypothetical protein